jgi:hypothetical protein
VYGLFADELDAADAAEAMSDHADAWTARPV